MPYSMRCSLPAVTSDLRDEPHCKTQPPLSEQVEFEMTDLRPNGAKNAEAAKATGIVAARIPITPYIKEPNAKIYIEQP